MIDSLYGFLAAIMRGFHAGLRLTQTGRIRWYAVGIAVGTVVVLGMAVFS